MNTLLILLFCVVSIQKTFSQNIRIDLRIKKFPFILAKDSLSIKKMLSDSAIVFCKKSLKYCFPNLVIADKTNADYHIKMVIVDTLTIKNHRSIWIYSTIYAPNTLITYIPEPLLSGISYQDNDYNSCFLTLFGQLSTSFRLLRDNIPVFLHNYVKNNNLSIENLKEIDKLEEVVIFYEKHNLLADSINTKILKLIEGGLLHNQEKFSFKKTNERRNKTYHFNYFIVKNGLGDSSITDNPLKIYFVLIKENDKYLLKIDKIRTKGVFKQQWEVKENLPIDLEMLNSNPSIIQRDISKNLWSFLRFNLNWE